jgi:hypothetical protein
MSGLNSQYWPSARHFTEALQCPLICFSNPQLRSTMPAVDRLGMPLVTSGQFAYVYKLRSNGNGGNAYAVRCFRSHLGDREQRYRAIHKHLQSHPIPALASFTYEPGGILVSGSRYPILSMEWIDGPTLDVYLDETVNRKEVVQHLSHEWLRLMKSLHDAEIAHGDLQHGNIIVEHGSLRLVDLDGMFVPEMKGWSASELGHQHFQHPRRTERFFSGKLDNFSALVIYLSLAALTERPSLWAEHHDENLLFTKSDFQNPGSSALFAKIRELGGEQGKLAEALAEAAKAGPETTPGLLDLVEIPDALPGWMTAPPNLDVVEKTREAVVVTESRTTAHSNWVPWDGKTQTAPSFAAMAAGGSAGAVAPYQNFGQMSRLAFGNAKELLGKGFLWWYWGAYMTLKLAGLEFFYSLPLAIFVVVVISIVFGYIRAYNDAQAASLAQPLVAPMMGAGPHPSGWTTPARMASSTPTYMAAPTAPNGHSVMGNRTLGIYHLPACSWAGKISKRNRVWFNSAVDAQTSGYRACKVCSPPAPVVLKRVP